MATATHGHASPPVHPGVPVHDYVRLLPELRRRAYATAADDWDSEVTARQVKAAFTVVDVLENIMVSLATYYPPGHFDSTNPRDYISELIASRFRWHRYHHEPDGRGNNGSIVRTLVTASVMRDLERMVDDVVGSLTLDWSGESAFDLEDWRTDWEQNANKGPSPLF